MTDDESNAGPIQKAIDAIDQVMSVHEDHLYPADEHALLCAREHLLIMSRQNFK